MSSGPDWSRIGRSSRNRGNAFERKVAKMLNQDLGTSFARTPASGGHEIEGDIYEPPDRGGRCDHLRIYCRTGWKWNWEDLLDCHETEKNPIGWYEGGNREIWIFRTLRNKLYVMFPYDLIMKDLPLNVPVLHFRHPDCFLQVVPYNWFLWLIRNENLDFFKQARQ